jgi:hypothetical protein
MRRPRRNLDRVEPEIMPILLSQRSSVLPAWERSSLRDLGTSQAFPGGIVLLNRHKRKGGVP